MIYVTTALRMTSPVGKPLHPDRELEQEVKNLPESSPLESYIRLFETWKSCEIVKTREAEQKAPSALVGQGILA